MSRRNTISREFFATIAAVLVLGLSVMCAIQAALSAAYFIGERKSSLTDVLNGATALSERFADEGSIVTKPLQGEDVLERAHSGFELFNTASGALVFIADENGQILLHTGDDAFTGAGVPASYIDELNEGYDIFETGTLDGVYCAKYYTAGRRITVGGQDGYLFAASPMAALGSYMTDMLTMFGISAAVILILCSILCWVLAKRITDVAGASSVFHQGLVTYANEAKTRLLGVPEELLASVGAVSPEVARCMAEQACTRYGSTWGVGISGIAGPGGATATKPVGLVYIALSNGRQTWLRVMRPHGRYMGRAWTRQRAASHALDMLRRAMLGLPVEMEA